MNIEIMQMQNTVNQFIEYVDFLYASEGGDISAEERADMVNALKMMAMGFITTETMKAMASEFGFEIPEGK